MCFRLKIFGCPVFPSLFWRMLCAPVIEGFMIDRTGRESLLQDTPVLTRRRLATLICASLVLLFTPEAFADDGESPGDKGADGDSTGDRGVTETGGDADDGHSAEVGSQRESGGDNDQETARKAVAEGHVLPLKDVLDLVDRDRYGIVIAVDLRRYKGNDIYRLKTRDGSGVIRDLRIDAHTGKFLNIFGF